MDKNLFTGKRDNTTQKSRKVADAISLHRRVQKNPTFVPRNKAGNKIHLSAAAGVSTEMSVAEQYRTAKMPWAYTELKRLLTLQLQHSEICEHEEQVAEDARRAVMRKDDPDLTFNLTTLKCARSGFYLIAGEIIFMHMDGSIFRKNGPTYYTEDVSDVDSSGNTFIAKKMISTCPCGMIH